MVLEEIQKRILSCAERRKAEIIQKAEQQRSEKMNDAKQEIAREEARLLAKGKQEAERERHRLISEANLGAKRNLLMAKDELMDTVLERAEAKLEAYTKQAGYGKTLGKLAKECEGELGKGATLYARKQDLKAVRGAKEKEMGPGVIGESKDGGLYLDNTFEMRMNRNKDTIRKELGSVLF